MLKKLIVFVVAFMASWPGFADVIKIKEGAPESYVVKKGDTLWDISAMYLDEPWLWPQIWQLNPQVENPHLIYPGDVLNLTYDADGNPQILANVAVDENNQPQTIETDNEPTPKPTLVIDRSYHKLSPTIRKTLKKQDAIPTLPLELIRPYLTFEQTLSAEKIDSLPYVLGNDDLVRHAVDTHILYVKGDLERGRVYGIYRKGAAYVNPDNGLELGYKAILVGTARAFRPGNKAQGEPSSVTVINVTREIKAGDKLMPAMDGQSLPAFFNLTKPEGNIDATIIGSSNDAREFSRMEVVVLNKGSVDNLKPGNVLNLYRPGGAVFDKDGKTVYLNEAGALAKIQAEFDNKGEDDQAVWHFPQERVGQVMVFKVYEETSYALIMQTFSPIRLGDKAVAP